MFVTEFTQTQHQTLSWELNPAHILTHYFFMFEMYVEGIHFEETESVSTEHSEQNNTGWDGKWHTQGLMYFLVVKIHCIYKNGDTDI
jgi:hypothetical protein